MIKAYSLACVAVLLTACSHSMNPASSFPSSEQGQFLPEVSQHGTPPVHWEIFLEPDNGNDTVYSWPLLEKSGVIVYGVTGGYPAGDPPQGSVAGINYSGSPATPTEKVNLGPNTQNFDQNVPVKIFQCGSGTQICSQGNELLFGPNDVQYYFGTVLQDSAPGLGNTVWATTANPPSEIVSGSNGVKHAYKIPDPKDNLQTIVATPDGNVWVTLQNHLTKAWMIARLQPGTSHVTVFPLQLNASPPQLLVGPDSNVWFALAKTLYRVNASTAAVSRFTLPHNANGYLNVGPGKTIWIGYLDSLSAQGFMETTDAGTVIGAFACPASVCAPGTWKNRIIQATQGADGNIWFVFSNFDIFNPAAPPNPTEGIGIYILHALSVSPSSVIFSAGGKTANIAFSEANYSGTFTAASTAQGVVKVVRFITPHEIQIQSVAKGTARIIIRDTLNNYYGVSVTVQ